MVKSNRKAAFATMALYRAARPLARTFTGKFFFLGGSTEFRKQADGSHAGDLSGIATKELVDVARPYTFPSLELSLIPDWETKLAKLTEAGIREKIRCQWRPIVDAKAIRYRAASDRQTNAAGCVARVAADRSWRNEIRFIS